MAGVKYTISGDASKAEKTLLSFEKKTKAIAKSIAKGFSERIGHKLFDGLSRAASKVPDFLGDAVNAASSMNEELGKSQAVFGASAKTIEGWSKKTADAFGISRLEALQATGTMGNLLRAFDVTEDKASKMATTLVELAADMGSFNEASIEDTLFAISGALRGEKESIQKLGVSFDDATLKQEAFSLELYSGTGALTANAKAMAAFGLIMKQTEIQHGNFADTSDDLANSKKRLMARFKDLKAEVGKSLLPVIKDLIKKLKETDFEDLAEKISKTIKVLIDLTPKIVAVGLAIQAIKIAVFFGQMTKGLISATSLWAAQTKVIRANTAEKIRNATAGAGAGAAGGAAGAAGGGLARGAAGGAAVGVLTKLPQALAALTVAFIGFKAGEFIGKPLADLIVPDGPMGFPSDQPPGAINPDEQRRRDEAALKKQKELNAAKAVEKSFVDWIAKEEEIQAEKEEKKKRETQKRLGTIKSIRDEYKKTVKILDARIRGDEKLVKQEEFRKKVIEEQKKSAVGGHMMGQLEAEEIVKKRDLAVKAETKREAEKDKQADALEKKISTTESDLDSAMGRSSITAVSSMQAIGGGGGVSGELNLQKTQTDLQRQLVGLQQKMVGLLEGVKTGVDQEPVSQH